MKNIFIILTIVLSLQTFSQNQKTIYVFEFDKKIDGIDFRDNSKDSLIAGFEIMLNGKKVYFSSSPIANGKRLTVNVTRKELSSIIKNDNKNKAYLYFIYLKDKKQYYSVDYIFRTITCE